MHSRFQTPKILNYCLLFSHFPDHFFNIFMFIFVTIIIAIFAIRYLFTIIPRWTQGFHNGLRMCLSYSKEEAIRLGNAHISTEHLFLGILRDGEGLGH